MAQINKNVLRFLKDVLFFKFVILLGLAPKLGDFWPVPKMI